MGERIPTDEARRSIMMKSGNRLELHGVTAFDCSGSFLRLWAREGFVMINEAEIDWMIVKNEARPGDEEHHAPGTNR